MNKSIPIRTIHLFPEVDNLLISKLKILTPDQWTTKTPAGNWTIKNLVAHLIDGNFRSLSMIRDGYFGENPGPIASYRELVSYLNRLNSDWIQATNRLSPRILVKLLEESGNEYREMLQSLKPFEKSLFSVAWAGEDISLNWFHIAREFTEKWHHSQQIFYALDESDKTLISERYYLPYLQTSMKALPSHFKKIETPGNALIKFRFYGDFEHVFWLKKRESGWDLLPFSKSKPDADLKIPNHLAWKIFTKGITPAKAQKLIELEGDEKLGNHFLTMLAVMA